MRVLDRRHILKAIGASLVAGLAATRASIATTIEKLELTAEQWRRRLTPEQYYILREEGTERSFTSPLNDEERAGSYHCAGCDLELFTSEMKYDSKTGWPSFFDVIKGRVDTKLDFYLVYPRREYHCARCGGHHGHVFDDGPEPTGLRYCNNGLALTFKPKVEEPKSES